MRVRYGSHGATGKSRQTRMKRHTSVRKNIHFHIYKRLRNMDVRRVLLSTTEERRAETKGVELIKVGGEAGEATG